jgi:hypothetical protein
VRRTVLLSLAVLASACARTGVSPLALAEPCSGHECLVQLFNNSGLDLAVRYADSTGRRELVGLVPATATKSFKVQHIHSAGIRVFATNPNGQIFAADIGFEPLRPTEVHFPDDFTQVADTLMPVRRRPSHH